MEVRSIDDVLHRLRIARVDFIKLDVEGAELDALKGATRLLRGAARPAMLVEVQDLRTQPWGYRASAIVEYLSSLDYRWFSLAPDGSLHPISTALESYDANLVAFPCERTREFRPVNRPKTSSWPPFRSSEIVSGIVTEISSRKILTSQLRTAPGSAASQIHDPSTTGVIPCSQHFQNQNTNATRNCRFS